MTTYDHSAFLTTGAARLSWAARLVANVADIYSAWKNRREIYRLGEYSDAALADIGLTRGDLHVAWRMPAGVDPTRQLGIFAEARAMQEARELGERAARMVN
ncbi:MAG: DUF1127 domain-containing protein [Mesorhizobium sp.]